MSHPSFPDPTPQRNGRSLRETLSQSVPHPGEPGWKKFLGWMVAIGTVVAGRKLGLTLGETSLIVGATGTYILGQGFADFGKNSREKVVTHVRQVAGTVFNDPDGEPAPKFPLLPPTLPKGRK